METVQSPEGKRRGCPFINVSKEHVPPYGVMMLVAPPDKRPPMSPSSASYIRHKALGTKFFGYSINNEYGVYTDKCDRWAMIQQDPHRFVFNGDVTVPPGGSGYCTFGEYPARATLQPGMLPIATNDFHFNYYAAIENSWNLHSSSRQGAFRFFGKIQERSLGIWVVPNILENRTYNIAGTFSANGAVTAAWDLLGIYDDSAGTGQTIADDWLFRQIYQIPPKPRPTTKPITCLMPGVYFLEYEGIASAWNPADEDTSLPYEVVVDNDAATADQLAAFASGVLTKTSNGYSASWPNQKFVGRLVFRAEEPVTVSIRQSLSNKVAISGAWRLIYDIRREDIFDQWYGYGYQNFWWVY